MEFLPLFLLLATQECPPPEDIYPCSCKKLLNGPSVSCHQLGTEVDLEKALRPLKGQKLRSLTISGVNASTLRPDIFDGIQVESLTLEKIEVDDASFRPGRRHLQGLERNLHTLSISKSFRNGHRPLGYIQLSHLTSLKHAIFENNDIPEVDNDWFKDGPTDLRTLIFERNGIEVLGDKAFSTLLNLDVLAVAGNNIRELKRSMFPPPEFRLRVLDLASNKLHELPKYIFSGFRDLEEVNLDNNLLHTLIIDTFPPILGGMTKVTMAGNPLVCDERIKWTCMHYEKVKIDGKCVSPAEWTGKTAHQYCQSNKLKLS